VVHARILLIALTGLILVAVVCSCPTAIGPSQPTATPIATSTPIPIVVDPSTMDQTGQPVLVTGEIEYTSPFFINSLKDSFVMLEDQAGFVRRNKEFEFSPRSQALGPVEVVGEGTLTYQILLPRIPQATFLDVDNDDLEETGVQIFAVAYWSNTWGDPFLEPRDGEGWSNAYASTVTDPDQDDEIQGGSLIVWAPDDDQAFPTGFGDDGLLFTADDPVASISAGYHIVNLDEEPFRRYQETQPEIDLVEGEGAVNDYSEMGYAEAFDALFEKVRVEYPFTEEKGIDWAGLYDRFAPRAEQASNDTYFYRVLREFTWAIPDGHVGVEINPDLFYTERGGGFGLILAELRDGRVIVTQVLPGLPAAQAGIEVGAEIIAWDGQPVTDAIDDTQAYFGPHSTAHRRRLEQIVFLTRVPPSEEVSVRFRNPQASSAEEVEMTAVVDYDSLFQALPYLSEDQLALPVQGQVLEESGLGYLRINTFSADYNLMADLWVHYIDRMIEAQVPGLILDVRTNGGGNARLALDFVGYFFDHEIPLVRRFYYNERTDAFEPEEVISRIEPGPEHYEGQIAVLVGPYCVSACESFTYAMTQEDRAIVVGHYPTAGAFGEVGRGQYEMPGDLSMQFPTGRPESPGGELIIEGVGIEPDVTVPVTEASALGEQDTLLREAVDALLDRIQ